MDREHIEKELHKLMTREISLLREFLASLQVEQMAILEQRTEDIRAIQQNRETLLESLMDARAARVEGIHQLVVACGLHPNPESPITEEECHEALNKCLTPEHCNLAILRDQMLALLDQLRVQTERNNYLLAKKITITRQLVDALTPSNPNRTYSGKGALNKKKTQVAVALINQEV